MNMLAKSGTAGTGKEWRRSQNSGDTCAIGIVWDEDLRCRYKGFNQTCAKNMGDLRHSQFVKARKVDSRAKSVL